MPEHNGFEVLREIRRNPATAGIPVIIHSSKSLSPAELSLLSDAGTVIYPKEAFGSEESMGRLQEALSAAGLQS
jgi:CheY-like chemotaxis protein